MEMVTGTRPAAARDHCGAGLGAGVPIDIGDGGGALDVLDVEDVDEDLLYICPQSARRDINFQRVPVVDTSNPFLSLFIPTLEESILVTRDLAKVEHSALAVIGGRRRSS